MPHLWNTTRNDWTSFLQMQLQRSMHESTCKLGGSKLEHWGYERYTSKASSTQGKIATHSCGLLQPCLRHLEGSKRCGTVEEVNDSKEGNRYHQS